MNELTDISKLIFWNINSLVHWETGLTFATREFISSSTIPCDNAQIKMTLTSWKFLSYKFTFVRSRNVEFMPSARPPRRKSLIFDVRCNHMNTVYGICMVL